MQLSTSARAANWTFGQRANFGRLLLGGLVALAAAAPAPAQAGTYEVHACRYGDEGPTGPAPGATGSDWERFGTTNGNGATRYSDGCGGPGATFHWEAGRYYRDGDQAGFLIREKADLQIAKVVWRGSASGLSGTPITAQATTSDNATPDLMDPQTGHDVQGDLRSWDIRPDATEVRLRLRCGRDYCDVGPSADARVTTARISALVSDANPPTASAISGTLTGPGYKAGTARIKFNAADVGSGLWRAHLEVDGTRAPARTSAFAGPSTCQWISTGRAFWTMQPCATTATDTVLALDTALLADGAHAVRLVLEDASGGEAAVHAATVRVNNPGGTVPDNACTDGLDNDNDGTLDFGADGECVSEQDTTEDAKGPLDDFDGDGRPNKDDPDDDGDGVRDEDDQSPFDRAHSGVKPIEAAPPVIEGPRGATGGAGTSGTAGAPGSAGAAGSGGAAGSTGAAGTSGTAGASATVDRGPLNGERASAQARLLVRFAKSTKRTVRVRYGQAVGIMGRLLDPSGRPIRGAEVTILARALVRGSDFVPVATVVTDADGDYRYLAPKGTSRVIRAAYRLHMNDTAFVSTSDVQLEVRPSVRLATSKGMLRNGGAVVFRGSVAGAPNDIRKLVELQAKVGRKWVTFGTTRLSGGRFQYRYRFTRTFRTTTYQFRVRVRPEASWPFADGTSKVIRVKVRP